MCDDVHCVDTEGIAKTTIRATGCRDPVAADTTY